MSTDSHLLRAIDAEAGLDSVDGSVPIFDTDYDKAPAKRPLTEAESEARCTSMQLCWLWILFGLLLAASAVLGTFGVVSFVRLPAPAAPVAPVPVPVSPPSLPLYTGQRVGFSVVYNTNGPFNSGATLPLVGWSSDNGAQATVGLYNAGSFDEVTGVFTVPSAGIYSMSFYALVSYTSPGATAQLVTTCTVYAGATAVTDARQMAFVAAGQVMRLTVEASKLVALTAGELITVACTNSNSGVNAAIEVGYLTHFDMERVAV